MHSGGKKMKKVAILKETNVGEDRVILLPKDIDDLTKKYEVYVEKGAGEKLGISDKEYINYGAIIKERDYCWKNSDFILKYKGPTVNEYKYLNENTKIAAIFHAEGNYGLLKELQEKKVTAYTYEFIETDDGFFPMAYPGGEIAGKMAVMYANFYQQRQYGGLGKALFSIRGCEKSKIAIIGYGNVGGAAIKLATALGNEVFVFGSNITKLKKNSVYMDENVHCIDSTKENLKKILPQMDAIIGAILISTYDTEPIITDEIFNSLRAGTVVIDVTCGYGKGYIPSIDKYTNLDNPIYISSNGVVCCKIDNLPSAYPKSTTEAYSSNAKEWIMKILDNELLGTINEDVLRGKIFDNGKISHQVIKEHWDYYERNNI